MESGEVIEGHSTGRVQAGEGSRKEDQLQPGLALRCPAAAKLPLVPWLPVLVQARVHPGLLLGVRDREGLSQHHANLPATTGTLGC